MKPANSCLMVGAIVVAVILPPAPASADPVEGLVSFSAGTTARADEVNGNFSEVADSVGDNDARIAALEDEIAALREQLSNVLNVNEYLSLETVNEQPTVRVSGANLQIVNSMGVTESSNGTGNLLIGYDERRPPTYRPECSLGTNPSDGTPVTNEDECIAAGGVFAVDHTGGSHYLVVGPGHNYSGWGGIVAGYYNSSNFQFASVSGGEGNTASGWASSVSGGQENFASGSNTSVSGGYRNTASGSWSSVSGGSRNTASGNLSSVGGGEKNYASGSIASVSGGRENIASGSDASVSGGYLNAASGSLSSVSGGAANTANGDSSSVSGGGGSTASGVDSTVSGGLNRSATGAYDWVAGSLSENQ